MTGVSVDTPVIFPLFFFAALAAARALSRFLR